jgi:hypothetical protein
MGGLLEVEHRPVVVQQCRFSIYGKSLGQVECIAFVCGVNSEARPMFISPNASSNYD